MKSILIVVPRYQDQRERSLRRADLFAAQFERALVELTRTLEGPGAIEAILVPWRADTRALIAVASLDDAASFDPEEGTGRDKRQSRVIPYVTNDSHDLADDIFWRASHLSLGREAMLTLPAAVEQYRPSYVVMLGDSPQPELFETSLLENEPKVLTFGSLATPQRLADVLQLPPDRIRDLEVNIRREDREAELTEDYSGFDRRAEGELEPFVPFGLLVQEYFSDLLFPEQIRRGD